uniref:Shootin-1 n=1 Tax=Salarias fasciatus TaxID=181472 RepID=A0A672HZC9_SALFA
MAAEEEPDRMTDGAQLLSGPVQEDQDPHRNHRTGSMEYKRLEEERDEAVKKLNEFQQVSQMVIEEVSAIQEDLELERMCRESAEALASQLNRQNRSLKRKSMMLLSHLSPETLTAIDLEDEDGDGDEEAACLSPQCHATVSELRADLELAVKRKNEVQAELEAVREELRATRDQLLKEEQDGAVLAAETLRLKKLLGSYNRVSQLAVEEYEALQHSLDLERDLRTEAEIFARTMVVEQKKLQRQSQILMQSSSPSQALQDAMGQVAQLTQQLETQRLEHQNQVQQMEERLRGSEAQRELSALRRKLELLQEQNDDHDLRRCQAEQQVKDLRLTVEELQKKLQAATNPPPAPAPAPAPPPPPPPPAPAAPTNPLRWDSLAVSGPEWGSSGRSAGSGQVCPGPGSAGA